MKRIFSLLLCAIVIFTCCVYQVNAVDEEDFAPYVIDFSLTSPDFEKESENAENRATGLILIYGLELSKSGSNIIIRGETYCNDEVVKSGFKNIMVQRKKVTGTSWSDYFDIGDIYDDTYAASINMTVAVAAGYQYRVTCKHYAKKSLLVTQSISNTSNVVSV